MPVRYAQARAAAEELGLPERWLNEQASAYIAPGGDSAASRVFDHPGLRVSAASLEHLLATKVLAGRRRDADDVKVLVAHLGLTSVDQVLALCLRPAWQLGDCKRHTRTCPPPCPPDCTSHARRCQARRGGGLVEVEVKSRAGRRGIVLPEQIYMLLMDHKSTQEQERERAVDLWVDEGWMFAQPNGRPIDPRRDMAEWKALLVEAGVRDARLHDARHTAATVLLEVPSAR